MVDRSTALQAKFLGPPEGKKYWHATHLAGDAFDGFYFPETITRYPKSMTQYLNLGSLVLFSVMELSELSTCGSGNADLNGKLPAIPDEYRRFLASVTNNVLEREIGILARSHAKASGLWVDSSRQGPAAAAIWAKLDKESRTTGPGLTLLTGDAEEMYYRGNYGTAEPLKFYGNGSRPRASSIVAEMARRTHEELREQPCKIHKWITPNCAIPDGTEAAIWFTTGIFRISIKALLPEGPKILSS